MSTDLAPSSITARPYQTQAVDQTFGEFKRGKESALVIMPTGTGKTAVAGLAARRARQDHGRRTLFLAHFDRLINQAASSFSRFGFDVSIEMAGQRALDDYYFGSKPDVVVGSVATMQNARLEQWEKDEFGLIITDECHHGIAQTYQKIYKHFRNYWHIGITATPDRGDKKNLGRIFNSIAYELKLTDAIKDGWLVRINYGMVPTNISLRDIRTTGGDLNQGDIEDKIGPNVEELCRGGLVYMEGRKAVVFTPDVGSSQAVADVMAQLGRKAAWIAGQPAMPRHEQDAILNAYAAGELDTICCCDKLIEGWDDPPTDCVVIMRPTKKRGRMAQMVGRGTRISPGTGKQDCLVVLFDWQDAEEHDLVQPYELFDDSDTDDDVWEVVKELTKEKNAGGEKQLDLFALMEEAKDIVARRSTLKIKLSGKTPSFKQIIYDPLGMSKVLDLGLNKGWHVGVGEPCTEKQANYLRSMGVECISGLNKLGASKAIDRMQKRRDAGLATAKQVALLISKGLDPTMAREAKFEQVNDYLAELARKKKS